MHTAPAAQFKMNFWWTRTRGFVCLTSQTINYFWMKYLKRVYDIFVIYLIYSYTKSQNVNFSSQIHHLAAFREPVKKTTLHYYHLNWCSDHRLHNLKPSAPSTFFSTLGKPSFVKKRDFLWNHFIKWWPSPRPPFMKSLFIFFRPFFEQKKIILKVVWRVLMGVLRVFEGCCRVFEVCLKGVWKKNGVRKNDWTLRQYVNVL